MSDIRFFKRAVVEDPHSWFSVHRKITYDDGRPPIFPGNAHQRIRTAMEDAMYWAKRGHCVYLAQGLFRNAGPHTFGRYPAADRKIPNLVACRSLYMDIDVKDGGYASTKDAATGLKHFVERAKLPAPTIIVGSGTGGLHVYWTLSTAFEVSEFRSMAARLVNAGHQHDLKFDPQCTSDPQRLLRIPGTWNFKGGPGVEGKPVLLHYVANTDIDIEAMREALGAYKAVTPVSNRATPALLTGPQITSQGFDLSENKDLSGGVGEYPPANIDDVAKLCPFIKHTLATGGTDLVGEPQWHLAAALACHCDDPSKTVHRLCEKNAFYDRDKTEEKLGIAQRAREQRPEIGPPKCAAISVTGVSQCASCPHFRLNTTPLGLPFKRINGHAFKVSPASPAASQIDLPPDYYRGPDELIYRRIVDDGGKNADVLAFEYQILPGSAIIEVGKPMHFLFDTIEGERQVSKRFECGIFANNAPFAEAMYSAAMPIVKVDPKVSRMMMASYLQVLREKKETMIDVPAFGWSLDHKGDWGFAYAGQFVSPSGTYKCTQPNDGTNNYRVLGDIQPWCDLVAKIVSVDRPDLAVMAASSFGAPLVGMTGEAGLLIGLVSAQSGIGKSTSLLAGQAVWSNPIVGGLSDTIIYTFSKLATLRHLPVFYDEIKGEKQLKAMTELAFQLTGGHDKGRADRSGNMRKVNEFKTLCGYAANASIVAGVRDEDKGTDASWLRMFEMQAVVLPNKAKDFALDVNQLLTSLHLNHGGVGRLYATFLGQNHMRVYKTLLSIQDKVRQDLGADPKVHRFWVAAISTTILGALLANSLGVTKFPVEAIRQFMYGEFRRMKAEMDADPSNFAEDTALITTIGAFLNEKFPKNLVLLDKTWTSRTRPPKDYAKILNDKNDSAWGPIQVQVSGDPLNIRISDTALGEWCARTKRPKAAFTNALVTKVGARRSVQTIGSGSRKGGAAENVWVINAKNTILEDMLDYAITYKFLPP